MTWFLICVHFQKIKSTIRGFVKLCYYVWYVKKYWLVYNWKNRIWKSPVLEKRCSRLAGKNSTSLHGRGNITCFSLRWSSHIVSKYSHWSGFFVEQIRSTQLCVRAKHNSLRPNKNHLFAWNMALFEYFSRLLGQIILIASFLLRSIVWRFKDVFWRGLTKLSWNFNSLLSWLFLAKMKTRAYYLYPYHV